MGQEQWRSTLIGLDWNEEEPAQIVPRFDMQTKECAELGGLVELAELGEAVKRWVMMHIFGEEPLELAHDTRFSRWELG